MRIKRLKELIANVDDDAFVVLNGSDHSYKHVYCADVTTAVIEKNSPDLMSEDGLGELFNNEERIQVVVIG